MLAPEETTPSEVRRTVAVQIALTSVFLLLMFVLRSGLDADPPPIWLIVALLVVVGVGAVLCERAWLRITPLAPDVEDPEGRALEVYAAQTTRKLGFGQGTVLLCVIVAFAADHAAWPVVIGALPALGVLVFETWPTARNLSLVEAMVEADGASTHLIEQFERDEPTESVEEEDE